MNEDQNMFATDDNQFLDAVAKKDNAEVLRLIQEKKYVLDLQTMDYILRNCRVEDVWLPLLALELEPIVNLEEHLENEMLHTVILRLPGDRVCVHGPSQWEKDLIDNMRKIMALPGIRAQELAIVEKLAKTNPEDRSHLNACEHSALHCALWHNRDQGPRSAMVIAILTSHPDYWNHQPTLDILRGFDIPGLAEALNEAKQNWAIANGHTGKVANRFIA